MKRRTSRTRPACRKAGSALAKKSTKKPARRKAASKLRACRGNPLGAHRFVASFFVRRGSDFLGVPLLASGEESAKREALSLARRVSREQGGKFTTTVVYRVDGPDIVLAEWSYNETSKTWRRVGAG